MTKEQIDALIEVRNQITDVCSDFVANTAAIDAVLAEIPAGQDNRVDLLLGRMCAQLPERVEYQTGNRCTCGAGYLSIPRNHEPWCDLRPGYIVSPAVMLEQPETAQLAEATVSVFEAEMRRLCADYDIEAPDYPGMWM